MFLAYLAILLWAPLPFASNRVWGWLLLSAMVGGVFTVWSARCCFGYMRIRREVWEAMRWPLLALLLVQSWVAVQLVPVPSALLAALSPVAAAMQGGGAHPLSLDPALTQLHLYRGLALVMMFTLTAALINSARRLRLLLAVLVVSGTAQAAYGALMVLTGVEYGFLIPKYVGLGSATGTFVNANHLAGYLNLCLAAGIGLLLAELGDGVSYGGWRSRFRSWLRLLLSGKLQLRICLALMVVGLLMTRSRMGNIAFFSSLAAVGGLLVLARDRFSWRVLFFLLSLVLVDLVLLGQWFGLDRILDRLATTDLAAEDRVSYLQPLLRYFADFWLTGSGGGSFYGIFPNYLPVGTTALPLHAHNDYLQFAVELGVACALLLYAVVLWGAWQAWRALRERRSRQLHGAALAVLMSIGWLALHAAVDFNLQLPVTALTFVTLLAIAPISRYLPR